jgi:signal transduction histidine kinase
VLIFLALFLAGLTTVYLLRQQQEQTARERVGRLAEPIARHAAFLQASGARPEEVEAALREEYDVRVLLIDRDDSMVVSDTGDSLRGTRISDIDPSAQARPESRFNVRRHKEGSDNLYLFTTPTVTIRLPGIGTFFPPYQTVLAVEQSDLQQAWRDLLPRLFMAGGVALLGSVFAAGWLARSITRPLRQITSASEEMARGRYDQQIPEYGGEEVARLSKAFNEMARQVGHSNRTLRDFLANVSHELKTPLTSIQGFSQAMVDGALHEPRDYADAGRIINEEALRMRGLVDDLLYLSQVEVGQVSMQFERLKPDEVLVATRERFAGRAGNADVRLTVESSATPEIEADARRIEQAVANIVDNAVRHTPAGGRVTLRASADNGHVQFTVHNTGSVIPPEALPRLFDRFFQVDPARARADGNTGLGLAITREIVEAHKGQIDVRSSEAQGTEFVITLPVEQRPSRAVDDGTGQAAL